MDDNSQDCDKLIRELERLEYLRRTGRLAEMTPLNYYWACERIRYLRELLQNWKAYD